MFFRWLHKGWKYFWRTIFALLLLVVLVAGIVIGVLQLDITKNYLANQIEQRVESRYHTDFDIADVDGFLPFHLQLHDVTITKGDSVSADTLLSIKQIDSNVDVWGLLQNKLTIVGFSVVEPIANFTSDKKGRLVFLERRADFQKRERSDQDRWLNKVEIIAPQVQIENGEVQLKAQTEEHKVGNLPRSFSVKDINTSLFVDWSANQRYLDIESFSARPTNLEVQQISASGQVFNNERFLEFNSFYVTLGNTQLIFNGEIDGVNILEPNVTGQLAEADYDLEVQSEEVYLPDLKDFWAEAPSVDQSLSFNFNTEGSADSLWIDRAEIGIGQSFVNINGLLQNLLDRQSLSYNLYFEGLNLRNQDLESFLDTLAIPNNRALQSMTVFGQAKGDLGRVEADFDLSSTLGRLTFKGQTQLRAPYEYKGQVTADSLDISPFLSSRLDTTSLSFTADLKGRGFSLDKAESEIKVDFNRSLVGNHQFEQASYTSALAGKIWEHRMEYLKEGKESFSGSVTMNYNYDDTKILAQGEAANIDLTDFLPANTVASTSLNLDYNVEAQGLDSERIQGRANLDIHPSVIGEDTVRAHQFYVDLNPPDASPRQLRMTSSLFDLSISGEVTPADVIAQARFWGQYLVNGFQSEITMTEPFDPSLPVDPPREKNVVLDGTLETKDLGLIKKYLPHFPSLYAESEVSFNVNTDGTRLLLSADMQADSLSYNGYKARDANTQFTGSVRSDRSLQEFSTFDWEANILRFETSKVDLDSVSVDLAVKQDSVHFNQRIAKISDNAEFNLTLNSSIADSAINVTIEDFYLGDNLYAWVNEHTPSFTYFRSGEVDFNRFSFRNRNEYFRLQGRLSPNRTDSLTYTLRNINLNRISDLIKGKIDFAGVLNGNFVTKSLSNQPTIQGDLDVNRLQLNDRMVGDVRFNSEFNQDQQRFDTRIEILTDSTKYEEYLQRNDGIGQNITLDGYFLTPEPSARQDSVFYFDADFEQVDLWFLALIADNVFTEVEGQATGTGYISGSFKDYDFGSHFETQNVFLRPKFLNTNYFVNGPVEFNKDEGVVLDSLNVMDTKGGTGTVWGSVDLNDFDPITYLDLSMDMNNLQFLNNKMDPDVPFYGNVSGTGLVRLSGSNTNAYLRTENPVQVTSDSEVSIPLLEETELQQSGKFIRFVDSFDEIDEKSQSAIQRTTADTEQAEEALEQALEELTFTERFDLDLQFEANQNVAVNLIFDPVIGDVLTAQGTGQLRITMQDQDVQMFGQYNINDGNYQFVTGEIISRRLQLEEGGTIIWEGPPDNARLNISAIYNARPNVSTLISDEGLNTQGQNGGQQVPIELIVEITGTLNSVENNYYFRLPSTLDLSSNSTLQYTINQINRDEQQKLLQATSILFTGQFIPTQGIGSGTATLSQNLTRGSTYLNPLLSNQVSSLLSNQINTLLNSDVSRLDIDFNLNAYNEVDLGIALRLYNDRLILRREGQITGGPQGTAGDRIGDLNATYRITRGLSLTAFHRQDQALNGVQATSPQAGDVTPYVDGLGLESRVQFNTWQELINRIKALFSGLFGNDDNSENNEQ